MHAVANLFGAGGSKYNPVRMLSGVTREGGRLAPNSDSAFCRLRVSVTEIRYIFKLLATDATQAELGWWHKA